MATIHDLFNRVNADALGASPEGWSWTETLNDIDIVSNAAASDGTAAVRNRARAETDLATDAHYVEFRITHLNSDGVSCGPCARYDSAADSCYIFLVRADASNYRLFKCVAGTLTQIGTTTTEALPALPLTARIEVNGTSIVGKINGVTKVSTTDSTFSGQVRTGIDVAENTVPGYSVVDSFVAGDLATDADGVWSWFSDPRAVTFNGATYWGVNGTEGDLIVRKLVHATGVITNFVLAANFQIEDHDNPSLLRTAANKIVAFYSTHSGGENQLRYRVAINADDISAFGAEGSRTVTSNSYAMPLTVSGHASPYWVFTRTYSGTDWAWGYVNTADFTTWGTYTDFWTSTGNLQLYLKACSNGVDRIDFIATDQSPYNGQSSIYHFYMQVVSGTATWFKSDGTSAGSLPLAPAAVTLVADGTTTRRWIWQIFNNGTTLCALGTHYPINDGTDIRYVFWKWSGSAWSEVEITSAGTSLYAAEWAYAGGICFDGDNPYQVYLSKKDGSSIPQMQQWNSSDSGATWTKTADITTGGSVFSIRPFSPAGRADATAVLYAKGIYTAYTDYGMSVLFAAAGGLAITPWLLVDTNEIVGANQS